MSAVASPRRAPRARPGRRADDAPGARARSFAPVVGKDARILILGSMPGAASLAAGQYYAHPYNQFWSILEEICGAGRHLRYGERLQRLKSRGVALWDVLHSCVREGSLDSAIEHHSAVPNEILGLLRRQPGITRICCNGGTAHRCLLRYFGPKLQALGIEVLRLPSTSPANARYSPASKRAAWRLALAHPPAMRPGVMPEHASELASEPAPGATPAPAPRCA